MERDLTLYSKENINTEPTQRTSKIKQDINEDSNYVTLQIKEEQLEIAKKLVQTEEVKAYIETFTEEKTFNIPITRKELIIEKKLLDSATLEYKDVPLETIRIPLSEEQVEFTKHNVTLENVSIYKNQIKDIKHIEETLKREKAKINIVGSPPVKDELTQSTHDF